MVEGGLGEEGKVGEGREEAEQVAERGLQSHS